MDKDERRALAESSLDRIHEFFPRVDTKASFVFALDTGMLASIALNLEAADFYVRHLLILGAVSVGLLFTSLYFIYRCQFPQLDGGSGSKIYFKEIATRPETKFIEEFMEETDQGMTKDLLGQVWRNSEILRQKYVALKYAFILTAIAVVPWFLFLIFATVHHAALKIS
jgi:hypothetical protein